jgi:hypothetical protein
VVHDAGNALGLQVDDLILYQAPIAAVDAFHLESVENCRAGDRADCRVHAGGVASRSQYADSLDCCHDVSVFGFEDIGKDKAFFYICKLSARHSRFDAKKIKTAATHADAVNSHVLLLAFLNRI